VNNQPAILYVEDEETDALLLRLGFERAGLSNPVLTVVDGTEAINYLAGAGRFADRTQYPVPSLVLLDLNLPRKSGLEVLQWARQQVQFRSLPIVVFTSSDCERDRSQARAFGASDYLLKPADIDQICEIARELSKRWCLAAAA
jgi:CheY-like chemotaxis protein